MLRSFNKEEKRYHELKHQVISVPTSYPKLQEKRKRPTCRIYVHAEGPKKAEKNINYENKPGVQVHADPNFAIINHVRARAEHASLGLKTRAENEARERVQVSCVHTHRAGT